MGKSHFCNSLMQHLREQSDRCAPVSKTRVVNACDEGITADIWVRRHIRSSSPLVNVLWAEEITQVDVSLWVQPGHLAFLANPPQLLQSGDSHLLCSIGSAWRSAVAPDRTMWESHTLRGACGGPLAGSSPAAFDIEGCATSPTFE